MLRKIEMTRAAPKMKVDAFQNRNDPELSDFEGPRKRGRAASGFFTEE
jgi:hypothetical protein